MDGFYKLMQVNTLSAMRLTSLAVPDMIKREKGHHEKQELLFPFVVEYPLGGWAADGTAFDPKGSSR